MDRNPFAPDFDALPGKLAVFPLDQVLLLPSGKLPLNIYEPRYKKMIEDALAGNRLIGMIQRRTGEDLYKVGCAGKITEFSETTDGRYLVTLTGISRFKIASELKSNAPYREIEPDWQAYRQDIEPRSCLDLNREKLVGLLKSYFTANEMKCDWDAVEGAPDGRLITCLAMICPFDAKEKQALLEAPCCKTRAETFMTMLEMAVKERKDCSSCH